MAYSLIVPAAYMGWLMWKGKPQRKCIIIRDVPYMQNPMVCGLTNSPSHIKYINTYDGPIREIESRIQSEIYKIQNDINLVRLIYSIIPYVPAIHLILNWLISSNPLLWWIIMIIYTGMLDYVKRTKYPNIIVINSLHILVRQMYPAFKLLGSSSYGYDIIIQHSSDRICDILLCKNRRDQIISAIENSTHDIYQMTRFARYLVKSSKIKVEVVNNIAELFNQLRNMDDDAKIRYLKTNLGNLPDKYKLIDRNSEYINEAIEESKVTVRSFNMLRKYINLQREQQGKQREEQQEEQQEEQREEQQEEQDDTDLLDALEEWRKNLDGKNISETQALSFLLLYHTENIYDNQLALEHLKQRMQI